MAEPTVAGTVIATVRSYFREFGILRACGREFWVVQLVNLLDAVAYFAMLTVSTLYLSETLGYNDSDAAWLWGACMLVYTGVGFVAGFIGDSFGIKRTLHLSVVLLVVSRLAVGFGTHKALVVPALFVIALGSAIMTPILISATKRYTTLENQTAGFNLLYFLMNVGAFAGNWVLDPLRAVPGGNRAVFMMGSAISILCWLAILLLWRRGIERVDARVRAASRPSAGNMGDPPGDVTPKEWEAPWTIAWSVFHEVAFWRFMLFLVILTGVRLVFEHQYQVYPKYYQRTMAECLFLMESGVGSELDAGRLPEELRQAFAEHGHALSVAANVAVNEPGSRWHVSDVERTYYVGQDEKKVSVYASEPPIGMLNAINPFIICFGVIVSTPIVARYKLFRVMYIGIVISAASMLFLVLDPGWFCGGLGWSIHKGYYLIAILQIIAFSIGEVIWSPRLYEYTAAVAPPNREASYMGLSSMPLFFARFAEGPLAGALLTRYCPPDIGSRLSATPYSTGPQMMSLILAAIALSTPVLILVFRGMTRQEARGDETKIG